MQHVAFRNVRKIDIKVFKTIRDVWENPLKQLAVNFEVCWFEGYFSIWADKDNLFCFPFKFSQSRSNKFHVACLDWHFVFCSFKGFLLWPYSVSGNIQKCISDCWYIIENFYNDLSQYHTQCYGAFLYTFPFWLIHSLLWDQSTHL